MASYFCAIIPERLCPFFAVDESTTREDRLAAELELYAHFEDVLGDEGREERRLGMVCCHTELALERCGVPYDRPVVVLADLPNRLWDFNGRRIQALRPRDVLTDDLHRLRRHYWASSPMQPRSPVATPVQYVVAFHVVVPSLGPDPRLPPRLGSYLESWPTVWEDAYCTIFALPVHPEGPQREVVAAWSRPLEAPLTGAGIDVPRPGQPSTDGGIEVIGWVLAEDAPVVGVEIDIDGTARALAPMGLARPELAAQFPGSAAAANAGFRAWIDLADLPRNNHLKVNALLEGEPPALLGEILVRTVAP